VTAAKNADGTIAVVVLNQSTEAKNFNISIGNKNTNISISPKAIQTITLIN